MEKQILICCGTGCRANGSMKVAEALSEVAKAKMCIRDRVTYDCRQFFDQMIQANLRIHGDVKGAIISP